jgi:ribosomal protein S18 acetylase RimI-like enzyme
MYAIKNLTIDEIPVIQSIAEKTWWPTYSNILDATQIRFMLDEIYSTDALTKVIEEGSQEFILLIDERGPQGFASFGAKPNEEDIYKLNKIYVLPQNHGRGYGKLLLSEVKRRISDKGIKILDLNVNRYNPAREFYEKLGFRVIKEEDVPIGPYFMNDYVMRLELPL